jgi:hypothetical protein
VQGVQASSDCLSGTSATRLWRGPDCRTCRSGGNQRLALRENGLNASRSRKVSIRSRSKKYPQNNWQNSSTIITKRSGQTLAPRASQTLKHGSRYRNRKRAVWSLLPVWHCWNWPQRTENGKTQRVISQSRVKPNGAADPEGFSAVGTPR